jgi:putative tricarboxylic transport membrane protein
MWALSPSLLRRSTAAAMAAIALTSSPSLAQLKSVEIMAPANPGGYNEFATQIKEGKLRALAIFSPERIKGVDIPTFKEQGVDVELVNWHAAIASDDIKPADLKVLDGAVGKMVRSPQRQTIAAEHGWVDSYLPADQFAAFLQDEQARIRTVLDDLGLLKQ